MEKAIDFEKNGLEICRRHLLKWMIGNQNYIEPQAWSCLQNRGIELFMV